MAFGQYSDDHKTREECQRASQPRKAGRFYVLFTTRGYSSSTGKHKSHAFRAIGYGATNVFYVSEVERPDLAKADYERRISESLQKAPRRRGDNIQRELAHAAELAEEANRFAEYTGFRWRLKLPANEELLEYAKQESQRAKEREKREAAKKARAMLAQDREHLEQWRRGERDILLKPEEMKRYRNAQIFTPADYALAQSRWDAAWEAWRNGEGYSAPERDQSNARLRLSFDRKEIQTSGGASFPVEHGIKAWPLLKRLKERGEEWQRNGHSIHLGHFQIDKVEADGTVTAGCHRVAFEEYARIARELGLS